MGKFQSLGRLGYHGLQGRDPDYGIDFVQPEIQSPEASVYREDGGEHGQKDGHHFHVRAEAQRKVLRGD